MKATKIIPHGRNTQGVLLSGICEFSDGKKWKWHRSNHTGEFFFTIDSGRATQWGVGDYVRMVAYPKRVAALRDLLGELGEET